MKNEKQWIPSKYRIAGGKLRVSLDAKELSPASRVSANAVINIYNRLFKDHLKGRLLDLGCGQVPFYGVYRSHVDEVYCVDWESSMHELSYIDQHADLTEDLPLESESFDTVLLSSVLEHIPTPSRLIEEIYRVLRADGKAIINVPFLYVLHEEPYDFYRYTKHALVRMAENASFTVEVLEPTGGAITVLFDLLSKALIRLPFGLSKLLYATNFVAYLSLGTSLGKKFDVKTATFMPNGYFLVVRK